VPADHSLERRDLGLIFLQQVSGLDIVVERASLILAHPDPDHLAVAFIL